jgi:hypothetical protein
VLSPDGSRLYVVTESRQTTPYEVKVYAQDAVTGNNADWGTNPYTLANYRYASDPSLGSYDYQGTSYRTVLCKVAGHATYAPRMLSLQATTGQSYGGAQINGGTAVGPAVAQKAWDDVYTARAYVAAWGASDSSRVLYAMDSVNTGIIRTWSIPSQYGGPQGDLAIGNPAGDTGLVMVTYDGAGHSYVWNVVFKSTAPPWNWINSGWNWISFPLETDTINPAENMDPSKLLGYDMTNRFYRWDREQKTMLLYPDDFTTVQVGEGYVLLLQQGVTLNPVYQGWPVDVEISPL